MVHAKAISQLKAYCSKAGRTQCLALHLESALKAIGRAAVQDATGPRMSAAKARAAIRGHGVVKKDAARHHLTLLIDSRVVLQHSNGDIEVVLFWSTDKRPMERSARWWAAYAAARERHRRAGVARRTQKSRRKKGDKIARSSLQVAETPSLFRDVTPKSFTAPQGAALLAVKESSGHMCPQDTAAPIEAVAATLQAPVAPVPTAAASVCGRTRPVKPLDIDEADHQAAEAPAIPASLDPEVAAFLTRATAAAKATPAACKVAVESEGVKAQPRGPAARPTPKTWATTPLEVARMAEDRGIDGVNAKAIANTGAPPELVREAFAVTLDALADVRRKRPQAPDAKRPVRPVKNAPAFLLGSVRLLMLNEARCRRTSPSSRARGP